MGNVLATDLVSIEAGRAVISADFLSFTSCCLLKSFTGGAS